MPDAMMLDPNNILLQVGDGHVEEYGNLAGVANVEKSRRVALLDFNQDGKLDLVVNRNADTDIYENVTKTQEPSGRWIAIDVYQNNSNTQAIGAWAELIADDKTYHREVTMDDGYASGSAVGSHFGIGAATKVKLQSRWPDGVKSKWNNAQAN